MSTRIRPFWRKVSTRIHFPLNCTVPWIRGPLKILNGIKLTLNDQGNHLDSYTISLESFSSFRGHPFQKPVTDQDFFCWFLQQAGSNAIRLMKFAVRANVRSKLLDTKRKCLLQTSKYLFEDSKHPYDIFLVFKTQWSKVGSYRKKMVLTDSFKDLARP